MNAVLETLAPNRAQQAIGQIAVELPGATAVFRRHKLDFCCGGNVTLPHKRLAVAGLDGRPVMAQGPDVVAVVDAA